MIDLHQHTTFSDGTDNLDEIIAKNIAAGVDTMAITDHDNIDAAVYLASNTHKHYGVKFVNGVELSTDFEGLPVHILAYGYDVNDPIILDILKTSKQLRLERIQKRIELLKSEFNITLTPEQLEKVALSNNPNKPMLGHFLIDLGYGNTLDEVIQKYLYHKLPDAKIETTVVLNKLKKSTATSVLAHPFGGVGEKRVDRETFKRRIAAFKNAGLMGLECYYSLYDEEEQQYLVNAANKNNLLISGGSDYHGKNKKVSIGELSNYGFKPQNTQATLLNAVNITEI